MMEGTYTLRRVGWEGSNPAFLDYPSWAEMEQYRNPPHALPSGGGEGLAATGATSSAVTGSGVVGNGAGISGGGIPGPRGGVGGSRLRNGAVNSPLR